jgi:hypothetical protein
MFSKKFPVVHLHKIHAASHHLTHPSNVKVLPVLLATTQEVQLFFFSMPMPPKRKIVTLAM